MREPQTRIRIAAPVSRVWRLLTEFDRYPTWTSQMRFRGRPIEGSWALLSIRTGSLPFVVPVRFVEVRQRRELCWAGGIPGLMRGAHYFRLTPGPDDSTELLQGERFEGLAVNAAWPVVEPSLSRLYADTNEAIRVAAEAAQPTGGSSRS